MLVMLKRFFIFETKNRGGGMWHLKQSGKIILQQQYILKVGTA